MCRRRVVSMLSVLMNVTVLWYAEVEQCMNDRSQNGALCARPAGRAGKFSLCTAQSVTQAPRPPSTTHQYNAPHKPQHHDPVRSCHAPLDDGGAVQNGTLVNLKIKQRKKSLAT